MKRRALILALLALLPLCACTNKLPEPEPIALGRISETEAEIAAEQSYELPLPLLSGETSSARELFTRAEHTVLTVLTSGDECLEQELSVLSAVDEALSGRGGQIVLLLRDADAAGQESMSEALRLNGDTLTCLLWSDALIGFDAPAFPCSFLLDGAGFVLGGAKLGADTAEGYLRWYDDTLAASPSQ